MDTRQSLSYKFKEIAKNSNFILFFLILKATHLLKLVDNKCIYEMDPASIVEHTDMLLTRDGQRDRRTDRRKDG